MVLNGGDFVLYKTFGNVWRHFGCHTAGGRGDGAMGKHPVGMDVIEMLQNII